jgi:hypothetical protein
MERVHEPGYVDSEQREAQGSDDDPSRGKESTQSESKRFAAEASFQAKADHHGEGNPEHGSLVRSGRPYGNQNQDVADGKFVEVAWGTIGVHEETSSSGIDVENGKNDADELSNDESYRVRSPLPGAHPPEKIGDLSPPMHVAAQIFVAK